MEHPVIKQSLNIAEMKEKGIAPFNMAQDTQWIPKNNATAYQSDFLGDETTCSLVTQLCSRSFLLRQMSTADPRN